MEKTTETIEQYLESLEPKHREVIQLLIDLIHKIDPSISHAVWRGVFWGDSEQTILGFGEYDYETKNGVTGSWFLIGLSRQKSYYSMYVSGVKDGDYLIKSYQDKLGKVKMGSSSISFTKIENVDLDNLEILFEEAISLYNAQN